MNNETMTVVEACAAGECVERTIYRNIEAGKLKAEKVNGSWVIDANSFRGWNAGRKATRERAEQTRATYEALARVYARRRADALHNFAALSGTYLEAYAALAEEKPDAREFDSAAAAVLRDAADRFAVVRSLSDETRDAYAAAQEAANEAKLDLDAERVEINATYSEGLQALTEEARRAGADIFNNRDLAGAVPSTLH